MLLKRFLSAVQGPQMPVVSTDAEVSPFGSAHIEAQPAKAAAPSAEWRFDMSDALVRHTLRRRSFAPTIER